MDDLFAAANGILCTLYALVMVAGIVSPQVRDGIVVKVGLIFMAVGFGALAVQSTGMHKPGGMLNVDRALLLTNAGAAVAALGYLRRKHHKRHPARRSSDWLPLDDNPSYWP